MKHLLTLALIALTTPAAAQAVSTARVPLNGGTAVFELYADDARLPECQGTRASALIAKLETPRGEVGYGTGCWIAGMDGNIRMLVKSFDDGRVRELTLPSSRFTDAAAAQRPTSKPKALIAKAEHLNDVCRDGRGTPEEVDRACDEREATMVQIKRQGWCWGPVEAVGADKRWIRCR